MTKSISEFTKRFIWPVDDKSFCYQINNISENELNYLLNKEKWRLFCDSIDKKTVVLKKEFGSFEEVKKYIQTNKIEAIDN